MPSERDIHVRACRDKRHAGKLSQRELDESQQVVHELKTDHRVIVCCAKTDTVC